MKLITLFLLTFLYSISSNCQVLPQIAFKTGPTFSGQIKTPDHFGDKGIILGLSVSAEPTIIKFGSKKQFDLNAELAFIQKGGVNYSPIYIYNSDGVLSGTGSESYNVRINYLSFAPLLKANIGQLFFAKIGPRADIFTGYKSKAQFTSHDKTDFNSTTAGITYGVGISAGQKQTKFICEIIGQNDLTSSSYNNLSRQTQTNYSVLLNIGIVYVFDKKNKNL